MKPEPCPFCKKQQSKPFYAETEHGGDWSVVCWGKYGGCGATGPLSPTKKKARDAWNKCGSKEVRDEC